MLGRADTHRCMVQLCLVDGAGTAVRCCELENAVQPYMYFFFFMVELPRTHDRTSPIVQRRTTMVRETKTYNGHRVVGVVQRSTAKTVHFLRHAEGQDKRNK